MEPLSGVVVPCDFAEVALRWKEARAIEALRKSAQRDEEKRLPPAHLEMGVDANGLRRDLEELGIFRRTHDGRVDIPRRIPCRLRPGTARRSQAASNESLARRLRCRPQVHETDNKGLSRLYFRDSPLRFLCRPCGPALFSQVAAGGPERHRLSRALR